MKTKFAKTLPKTADEITNGGVYSQRVRCGKKNCKCARGETHTAFYFFTSRNGKLIKFYVRKVEVEQFSSLVRQTIAERKQRRQTTKSNLDLLRKLRQSLRERDSLIRSLKGNENYV